MIDDVYTFSNIRFAAPPTGRNRFRAPKRPKKQVGIQDGSEGHSCYQSNPSQFLVARPVSNGITQSEDCLFLDVFVPGWIVRGQNLKDERVAIVHWIFGGGFGLGLHHICLLTISPRHERVVWWRGLSAGIKEYIDLCEI